MAEFRIRDRKTLLGLMVPLFTKYPLYSIKQLHFSQWAKALETLERAELTSAEKNDILSKLKSDLSVGVPTPPVKKKGVPPRSGETLSEKKGEKKKGSAYTSPSWKGGEPSDEWIHGFVEAEGSFSFAKKEGGAPLKTPPKRRDLSATSPSLPQITHSFGLTGKLDPMIFKFLRKKLDIRTKVLQTKQGSEKLETRSPRSIERVRDFFSNKLKGVKGLEYKIWAKSLSFKGSGKSERLLKVRDLLRKIKTHQKV